MGGSKLEGVGCKMTWNCLQYGLDIKKVSAFEYFLKQ
jgi:hypothetical protein